MKKFYLLFLLLLVFCSFATASQSSITQSEITDNIKELQDSNANSDIQVEEQKQVYELKKEALLTISDNILILIKGFIILVVDLIKLLILYIEMRLMIYIITKLIPKLFMAVVNGIASGLGGSTE